MGCGKPVGKRPMAWPQGPFSARFEWLALAAKRWNQAPQARSCSVRLTASFVLVRRHMTRFIAFAFTMLVAASAGAAGPAAPITATEALTKICEHHSDEPVCAADARKRLTM